MIAYAGNRVTDDVLMPVRHHVWMRKASKLIMAVRLIPRVTVWIKKFEVAGIGGRAPRVLTKERLSVVTSPRYTQGVAGLSQK